MGNKKLIKKANKEYQKTIDLGYNPNNFTGRYPFLSGDSGVSQFSSEADFWKMCYDDAIRLNEQDPIYYANFYTLLNRDDLNKADVQATYYNLMDNNLDNFGLISDVNGSKQYILNLNNDGEPKSYEYFLVPGNRTHNGKGIVSVHSNGNLSELYNVNLEDWDALNANLQKGIESRFPED